MVPHDASEPPILSRRFVPMASSTQGCFVPGCHTRYIAVALLQPRWHWAIPSVQLG